MPQRGFGETASPAAPAPLDIRLLGPLEVEVHGRAVGLPSRKERALLVALALHPGRPVGRHTLAAALWDHALPAGWAKGLQVNVSRVRRRLGDAGMADPGQVLAFRQDCYVLDVGPDQVDGHRFGALVAEARSLLADQPARAHARLDAALALWRGDPLVDIADTSAGRGEAARLREMHHGAVEDRFEADLALGRHQSTVGSLEAALAQEPLRERRWGQLMLALYRCGRQGDALRAYQRARTVLGEELGLEPGPTLRRLEAAVIAQDPALDLPRAGEDALVGRDPSPAAGAGGREAAARVAHGPGAGAPAPTAPAPLASAPSGIADPAGTPPPAAAASFRSGGAAAGPPGIDLAADSVQLLREFRTKLDPGDPLHDRIRATLVPALLWQGEWEEAVAASQHPVRPPEPDDQPADGDADDTPADGTPGG